MNEIFNLSIMVQNDLQSLCIVTKSVPAKFGVPGTFRRRTRGWIQNRPICDFRVSEFLYPLGDGLLRGEDSTFSA